MAANDWHLSKTVTVGNMLTMFLAIMAMVGSYYTLDKRLALLEHSSMEQEKDITQLRTEVMVELKEIKSLIMKIHFNYGDD